MTCTRLSWRSEHHGGTPLSVVRHRVPVGGYGAAHDHDFLELFWIESGRLEHRFSGHPPQVLEPGDLQCVRAGDAHAFAACAPGPAVLVNVSFPAAAAAPAAALAGAAWP
ncbi:MAG: cupin domain-containing protein, partial [Planctomycetes bacterium]|nr:cupin domain-containing protein [Planctomycetota bacterium]